MRKQFTDEEVRNGYVFPLLQVGWRRAMPMSRPDSKLWLGIWYQAYEVCAREWAVWHNGGQYLGVMRHPLENVLYEAQRATELIQADHFGPEPETKEETTSCE